MYSNDKQHNNFSKPDLVTRSYSPTLRVAVVVAIFVIAVFVLAACGSKTKSATTSTTAPRQSTVATPSAATSSASTSNASTPSASTPSASISSAALTCTADKSSDSIDVGKYFGDILAQVRKQWKADAVISSVRFQRPAATTFQDLCGLKTDSDWQMIFYSLSGKNEISGYLNNAKKDSAGVPPVNFAVDKADGLTSSGLTFAEMRKQGGWVFHEYSRPETYSLESKYPANFFTGWKMSMSETVQKLIDRVREEKISAYGFNVYMGKASTKTRTPYVSLYWQNSPKKTSFFVEPVSLKTYDQSY